ncbi:hypothetical protein ABTD90_20665, partial [Acinetobacter baumannii]
AALVDKARAWFDVRELPAGADASSIQQAVAEAGAGGPSFAALAKDGRGVVFTLKPGVDTATHPTLGARPAVLRKTDVAVLHSA